MNLRAISKTLLFRVLVAIILGIICSLFFPRWLAQIFTTFNGLFSNFLSFFIPILIFALITPSIASAGRGAGKWLGIVTAVSYFSTILTGLFAYAVARLLYPWLLANQENVAAIDLESNALTPYFSVEMPPPFDIMTALLLAFSIGVAMTAVKSDTLLSVSQDLERVVMKVIVSFVIPLLPLFIFGIFLGFGMNGGLVDIIAAFAKVLFVAIIGTFVLIGFQYLVAGIVCKQNPWKLFKNILPAYVTALGTSSSAATIPVTYKQVLKNGVSKRVAGFIVPLCSTIHLSGSMLKITLFAFAIVQMYRMEISVFQAIGFLLMLGITMVAAPGVPGGAIMAAVGLLSSMLGFDTDQVALMIAAYIAIDSFGTAANVAGDGAIALVINRFAKNEINDDDEVELPSEKVATQT